MTTSQLRRLLAPLASGSRKQRKAQINRVLASPYSATVAADDGLVIELYDQAGAVVQRGVGPNSAARLFAHVHGRCLSDCGFCYDEACKIREPRGTVREEVRTSPTAAAMSRLSTDAILPSFRGRIVFKDGTQKPLP